MNGLELSEKFYEEYGKEMLREKFADIEPYLAVGLVGSGSECFGYDDALSHDHDFEPGFCIFLPDENIVDSRTEFALERAYAALPREFMGFHRSRLQPVGGNRHGVLRIGSFFEAKTGSATADLSVTDWLQLPEQFLLEATNGKIFCDRYGLLTQYREKLACLPTDVRLKKLAGNLLLMAQGGPYNYTRCIQRNETAAAQLAVCEFVNAALRVIFLLNGQYIPYYKWVFRALRELPQLSALHDSLAFLLASDNTPVQVCRKQALIEEIAAQILTVLTEQGFSKSPSKELEHHAYSVNDAVRDPYVRNLNILCAVS